MASYKSVHQQDQAYQAKSGFLKSESSIELRSANPSLTSLHRSLAGHSGSSETGAADDRQRLLSNTNVEPRNAEWKPGFWAQFPYLGLLALFGILAGAVASIVILVTSHRRPVDEWGYKIAPSVYLAVASVIANALSTYALATGLVISFWRTALRGRTLAELNQNWVSGNSLRHALLQGYRVGGRTTALACIMSVLSLLRGPLNQRASAVQGNVSYNTFGTMPLVVAQQLPEGYTGKSEDSRTSIMETARLTSDFAEIMRDYSTRSNITIQHSQCGRTCTASVKGFGFKTACDILESVQYMGVSSFFNQDLFATSATLYQIGELDAGQRYWQNAGIRLNATYQIPLREDDKTANLSMAFRYKSHLCNLTGAIVEYKLQLASSTVTLAPNRSDDRFSEDLALSGPGTWGHDSTIGGFQYAASYLFTSNATFLFKGAISSTTFTGSLANEMFQGEETFGNATFKDPMDNMLDTMREIAFRTAVRAGKDQANVTNATQQVEFHGSDTRSIYVTDFRYMAAAAVVSALGILAIGATFYGWWELGRDVSLSPLEIAKAFDAPLLAHVGSNVDLSKNKNLGVAGSVRVRYGERLDEEDIGAKEDLRDASEASSHRLVLDLFGQVKKPVAGEVYGI